jgi:hypothetical protein
LVLVICFMGAIVVVLERCNCGVTAYMVAGVWRSRFCEVEEILQHQCRAVPTFVPEAHYMKLLLINTQFSKLAHRKFRDRLSVLDHGMRRNLEMGWKQASFASLIHAIHLGHARQPTGYSSQQNAYNITNAHM